MKVTHDNVAPRLDYLPVPLFDVVSIRFTPIRPWRPVPIRNATLPSQDRLLLHDNR